MKPPKNILLVEDDVKDIELTLITLKKFSFGNNITIVQDGVEALNYLFYRGQYTERTKENPILIILDLKMPKLDGLQVLKEIKNNKQTSLIPVVILSSSNENSDLEQCYKLGANAYVVKPVKFTEFADKIRNIAEFWNQANEPPPEYFGD